MNQNCSCVFVSNDDPVTSISQTYQKARKGHVCDECNGHIVPGAFYERYVFKECNSRFVTVHKTCETCLEIRNTFFCDAFNFGDVWHDLTEYIYQTCAKHITSECLMALSPRVRELVIDAIDGCWKDLEEDLWKFTGLSNQLNKRII